MWDKITLTVLNKSLIDGFTIFYDGKRSSQGSLNDLFRKTGS